MSLWHLDYRQGRDTSVPTRKERGINHGEDSRKTVP